MKIYVNVNAGHDGNGTEQMPFRHINDAAKIAQPGDEVWVAPGVYREYVDPVHAGREDARITYRSVEPLGAVITGAERIQSWVPYKENVWVCRVANSLFGNYNPYTTMVYGDWYFAKADKHTGCVYLNNRALYEAGSVEECIKAEVYECSWVPEESTYKWYTEQDQEKDETVIYANFHGADPNEENVEINVRRECFMPSKTGVGYITVSGFVVTKAATTWAPPAAYQDGMIGPHWSKGWIIEDCEISNSKCAGISLGKYYDPENDHYFTNKYVKSPTQMERDAVCRGQYHGWLKEKVGSHIIRRNNIHHCEQGGIIGRMGGVFSIIEDNHIHHINNKQNLAGAEIGGIKMHAAIDVIIRRNHFHHCTRGLWLDWQAQGTRVTGNLFHDNALPNDFEAGDDAVTSVGEDIFVEVSHGPTLIDHNILLSDRALKIATQGVALVHNLICGSLVSVGIGTDNGAPDIPSPRYTPYHTKHGTQVAGFMTILHGDDRFYNNIFVQKPIRPCMQDLADLMGNNGNMWDDCNVITGTFKFNGYPTFDEWNRQFEGYCGMGSETTGNCYYDHLPVWASGNLYFNGARAWEKETDAVTDTEHTVDISVEEKEDGWYLKTNLYDIIKEENDGIISTETLGMAFEPEQKYENPDGSPIIFNQDFFGNHRDVKTVAGPFTDKKASEQKLF